MVMTVGVALFVRSGSAQPAPVNTEALVTKIDTVTVLNFDTDRPVRQVRALVDGKVVATNGWNNSSTGIKIAVVERATNVSVHLQVGDEGGVLDLPFAMSTRANVAVSASYGPGRRLKLADWIEVFGVDQSMYGEVQTSLRIEVR